MMRIYGYLNLNQLKGINEEETSDVELQKMAEKRVTSTWYLNHSL